MSDILEVVKGLCGCSKRKYKCLLLGKDGSGKTTFLYKMRLNEILQTIPTIGFNVETIKMNGAEFEAWDLGGQDRLVPIWRHYAQNVENGIIFFIGNRDQQDFEDSVALFEEAVNVVDTTGHTVVPLAVVVNMFDGSPDRTEQEVREALGLQRAKFQQWPIRVF